MGSFAPVNINGVPNQLVVSVPDTVDKSLPRRFTPKLRSGYFYIQDRRHVLYGKKASCYLEDITWYDKDLSDQPIPGTERVWVKGVEVTGTGHYRFNGSHVQVNGASLTHPGVLVEEINYDVTFLDPIDLGGVLNPDDQVRVEYEYNDWANSVYATLNIVDGSLAVAGINLVSTAGGAGGNNIQLRINATGGAGSTATVSLVSGVLYELDWFNSTTVATVVAALQTSGLPWTATDDGNGTPGTDLFSALLTAAAVVPVATIDFAGGINAGFTLQTQTEVFRIGDTDPLFQLPVTPKNSLPVVMTDDRMQHWDRRNISPEFTVDDDGYVEFNVPRNYVANEDFSADLDLWMTQGSPAIEDSDVSFTKPRSFSAAQYADLPADTDYIAQFLPAFDEDEQMLSLVARGVNGQDLIVDLTFYDNSWNSLGTRQAVFTMNGDWKQFNYSLGPTGQTRTYDAAPFADSTYVLMSIHPDTGNTNIHVDYVFWGKTKLPPDPWYPNPRITVEWDCGDTVYYEHQPLLVYDQFGEARANIKPLETCNTHAASNSKTDGFLYLYGFNDKPDFRLGLGGINAPLGDFDSPFPNGPQANNPVIWAEAIPGGGFYLGGTFTSIGGHSTAGVAKILQDGTVDTNFAITSIDSGVGGQVLCLKYDPVDDILYIGGSFSGINGTTRNAMAAVDGSDGTLLSFDPDITDSTPPAAIRGIAIDRLDINGVMIHVGGSFDDVNGTARNNYAKLNSSGVAQSFNPNPNGIVYSLVLGEDRNLYFGGSFTNIGATARNRLARFDADTESLDTGFDPDVNGISFKMDVFGSYLYFVGSFTTVGGTTRNRAAAVSIVDGSLSSWDPNVNATVNYLWVEYDHVFLAGNFTTVGGLTRDGTAQVSRIDASVSSWSPILDNDGYAVAVSEGLIVIGGDFTTVSGEAFADVAFFKYYDNKPVDGRRWLPYSKADGLGKLQHVAHLRYNAESWTKEVTDIVPAPISTKLELLPSYGLVRNSAVSTLIGTVGSPAPAILAGVNTIQVSPVITKFMVPGDFLYFQTKLHESINMFQVVDISDDVIPVLTLNKPFPVDVPKNTQIVIEYTQLKAFVGQQRVVRLRLTDQYGAPVGQHRIQVTNRSVNVVQVDWDLPTNQDGEVAFLLTFLSAGVMELVFSGSPEVKLFGSISALPSPLEITDSPVGPATCNVAFNNSRATWT